MGLDIFFLALSLGLILLASVLFTNAIELMGSRLNLHAGATGSILAAIGTALPETVIPIIAVAVFRDERAKEVAIGAIAGAPFMLATLAFFVTGVAVLVYTALRKRTRKMRIDRGVLVRDLAYFILVYGLAIAATFLGDLLPADLVLAAKIVLCVGLLGAYALYLKRTLSSEAHQLEDFEPLMISRIFRAKEHTSLVVLQLLLALGLMIFSAHLFVQYTESVSITLGMSTLVLSLIITPIATELPEKFNSVLWIGKRKDVLALGNITGAMVFQGCIPVVFGILFTPWNLMQNHGITMVSAVLAMASALITLLCVRFFKRLNAPILLLGGLLYGVFVVYVMNMGH